MLYYDHRRKNNPNPNKEGDIKIGNLQKLLKKYNFDYTSVISTCIYDGEYYILIIDDRKIYIIVEMKEDRFIYITDDKLKTEIMRKILKQYFGRY
ncbi:hypothetical protein RASY3_13985 [Ruminococcus albus SY3]|uniref:Uncharacterized protein n=1 Tax=Ruminococcus albus SY3 TaxID=1341156 RepID=A0A011VT87_RUMAL|nr:hypothetical protein RASY3_13985 [Ruminococcus albus SY3]